MKEKPTEKQLFDALISQTAYGIWVSLGKLQNPVSGETSVDLDQASIQIDMLDMINNKMIINIFILFISIFFLSIEKIKLSWEISTLHNNYANLRIEHDNLKDLNLKLTTQFYIKNSPASIEKIAKESLGMEKKRPRKISNDK